MTLVRKSREAIDAAFNIPALVLAGREALVREVEERTGFDTIGIDETFSCLEDVLVRVIERARGLP